MINVFDTADMSQSIFIPCIMIVAFIILGILN